MRHFQQATLSILLRSSTGIFSSKCCISTTPEACHGAFVAELHCSTVTSISVSGESKCKRQTKLHRCRTTPHSSPIDFAPEHKPLVEHYHEVRGCISPSACPCNRLSLLIQAGPKVGRPTEARDTAPKMSYRLSLLIQAVPKIWRAMEAGDDRTRGIRAWRAAIIVLILLVQADGQRLSALAPGLRVEALRRQQVLRRRHVLDRPCLHAWADTAQLSRSCAAHGGSP